MTTKLKRTLKRRLPRSVVIFIQRSRFARKIGKLTAADDKDFLGLSRFVAPGETVVDIGANMGHFTKFLSSHVGSQGIVYSIEPIPESYQLLRYITKKLNLANVKLFDCAVSDRNDVVTMEVPLTASGEENLYEARITPNAGGAHSSRTLTVTTRTIDSLIPWKEHPVSFIKCDVEGHELPCLKGSVSLMEHNRPSWLIEIWGDLDEPGSPAVATVEFLRTFGYRPFIFDGSSFHPRKKGEKDVNYFFFTEKHCERYGQLLTRDA
jgi:FkbM family methyltransferase